MKNLMFNLGKTLSKTEQRSINGGTGDCQLPPPVNGTQTQLCPPGCAVVINPITCNYWCQC